MNQIRVGRIEYLNLVPFFKELEKLAADLDLSFAEGVPSQLNQMLRAGELDVSPASTVCLCDESLEAFAPVGVKTNGPVQSVYLSIPEGTGISSSDFYKALKEKTSFPIPPTIWTSSESETSVQLCKLLAKKVFSKKFIISKEPKAQASDWQLWIGDQALQRRPQFGDVVDLSEAWKAFTGRGFVFAKWICRKGWKNETLKTALVQAAQKADAQLSTDPQTYWDESLSARGVRKQSVTAYWKGIRYFVDDSAEEDLQFFIRWPTTAI
jgi:chorismate dehydratase